MPVRLSYFGGMFTGIGGVILVVSIWLPSLTLYIASYVLLALVVVISVLNTFFREKGIVGFVHPDELLFGNIFAFLFVISEIICAGYFMKLGTLSPLPGTPQLESVQAMFNYATVLVVTFILLFLLEILQVSLMKDVKPKQRTKETMSRLIMFSMVLGFIISAILAAFNQMYFIYGFESSAIVLGSFSAVFLFVLGFVLYTKYEEVPA